MLEGIMPQLAGIIVLGVGAQWLAWRVGFPSILLLLVIGVIAGPVVGWLNPDDLFGTILTPVVSLSVALILYEGGLTLKLSDLPKVGSVIRNLVSVGALVTLIISALAAHYILGMGLALSALVGAVLVVTGPTVIAPLLRHIRPSGPVGPILRWEGIVIDPIGALTTVLIFEVIVIGETQQAVAHVLIGLAKTIFLGGGVGVAAALVLALVLKKRWIADHLENPASLMLVVAVFAISNSLQHESGLFAVTVMGIVLANQRWVTVEHILEFKENIGILLISGLFIVLAARVQLADLQAVWLRGLMFVGVLIFIARPLTTLVSTWGAKLSFKEKAFIAWMAPRGIVAAAVASVFALKLEQHAAQQGSAESYAGVELLVPITFLTIITTVAVYGLTSPLLARKLKLAESSPQGVLFCGASPWVRDVALLLQKKGIRVLLVDNNRDLTQAARMAGLPAFNGSVLAEHTMENLDLGGIGRMLAVTSNPWVNALACQRFARLFGKGSCWQLVPPQDAKSRQRHEHIFGKPLFAEKATWRMLQRAHDSGFVAKGSGLSEQFDFAAWQKEYGPSALPMFTISEEGKLKIISASDQPQPEAGETLLALVRENEERELAKEGAKVAKSAANSG